MASPLVMTEGRTARDCTEPARTTTESEATTRPSPFMIRVSARQLESVGTISGLIYAASTVGGIAGVFVAGYVFIDYLTVTAIFRAIGILTMLLAGLSLVLDRWLVGAKS